MDIYKCLKKTTPSISSVHTDPIFKEHLMKFLYCL